jgi:hypothetical protein
MDAFVFEEAFAKTKGQPFERNGRTYRLMKEVHVEQGKGLKVEFITSKGPYRQGLHIEADTALRVNRQETEQMLLWEDTAPQSVHVECQPGEVRIWNIWDTGDGVVESWHNGAAMIAEEEGRGVWLLRCNDGRPNDDCDDLIVRVSICEARCS